MKAAAEVYAPVSGEVGEGNDALEGNPVLVNEDADESCWFFKMKLADQGELDGLMDEAAYTAYVKELD